VIAVLVPDSLTILIPGTSQTMSASASAASTPTRTRANAANRSTASSSPPSAGATPRSPPGPSWPTWPPTSRPPSKPWTKTSASRFYRPRPASPRPYSGSRSSPVPLALPRPRRAVEPASPRVRFQGQGPVLAVVRPAAGIVVAPVVVGTAPVLVPRPLFVRVTERATPGRPAHLRDRAAVVPAVDPGRAPAVLAAGRRRYLQALGVDAGPGRAVLGQRRAHRRPGQDQHQHRHGDPAAPFPAQSAPPRCLPHAGQSSRNPHQKPCPGQTVPAPFLSVARGPPAPIAS